MQRFVISESAIGFNILWLNRVLVFRTCGFSRRGILRGCMDAEIADNQYPRNYSINDRCRYLRTGNRFYPPRRSGIYFSISRSRQMFLPWQHRFLLQSLRRNRASNGLNDPCILDRANESGNIPAPSLLGLEMNDSFQLAVGNWLWTFNVGYYVSGLGCFFLFLLRYAFSGHRSGWCGRASQTNSV